MKGQEKSTIKTHAAGRPGLREKLERLILLLLAFLGGVSLLVVTLAGYLIWQRNGEILENRIRETLMTRGEGLARIHAGVFESLVSDNALTELQRNLADAVSEQDVVYGAYIDAEGLLWAYCSPTHPCQGAKTPSLTPGEAMEDLGLTKKPLLLSSPSTRKANLFDQTVLEFAHPLVVDGKPAGALRYGLSTRRLEQTLAQQAASHRTYTASTLMVMVTVVLAALLGGIVLARRTARRITEPLDSLARASAELAAGQRDTRVKISSADELELLGESFNLMATDLEESYAALEKRNADLQREIKEKREAVAERGELQGHLIQAQKMEAFGQLAGGVAHDFNNILAVVMGSSELVRMMLNERQYEDVKDLNEQIADAAQGGANLTRQLLSFARHEKTKPCVVDVASAVLKFERFIRRILEENVKLTIEVDEGVGNIWIDPGRLEQALMNLCVNARDAMPQGGSLRVTVRHVVVNEPLETSTGTALPGNYTAIETFDRGTGIPEQVLEKIFEPFYTTKAAGKGTGLGLSMVHNIVEEGHGFIDIQPNKGGGTVFSLYFPVHEGDSPTVRDVDAPPLPHGRGAKILLCEDDPRVRSMTERLLRRSNFDVTAVPSGKDALRALKDSSFSLLITDAVMPEMDGGTLAQLVKSSHPNLPLLIISGYTGGVLERAGIDEEGPHFLRKPYLADDLLGRVNELLS